MKHLLNKKQIEEIEKYTPFKVTINKPFGMYELRYQKSKYKKLIVYLRIDSMMDERPLYRQMSGYNANFDPEIEAAKRFLALREDTLQNLLDYYLMVKKDLNLLDKVMNKK